MLIEKIKADQITARKNHDPVVAPLLTTLLGEAMAIGKNAGNREPTDAEVVALVKKFMKGVDEYITVLTKDADSVAAAVLDETVKLTTLQIERTVLEGYLPKQMTTQELEDTIKKAIAEVGANMGKVMGYLKANFEGQYDGKMASIVLKSLL